MLKKLTGYFFIVVGLVGFEFFKNYKGSLIPYSTVWFYISIVIGIFGIALVSLSKSNKFSKQEKYNMERLDRLKQNGEKIELTIENCEIKENNYYQEVITESSSRTQQIDALYDPNRNYQQRYIEQSAIIYYYKINGGEHRMTSQSFSLNATALRNYIEKKMLVLYVNRFDKNEYIFDFIG